MNENSLLAFALTATIIELTRGPNMGNLAVLDEPCSTIDQISSTKIEQPIAELKRDHTIIIVTHNPQQTARVSDFAGFIFLGELIGFGAEEEVFRSPTDPRTQVLSLTLPDEKNRSRT